MSAPRPAKMIRPLVQKLHAYVPGEQPKIKNLIKLNTNENPYPPAPQVLHVIRKAVDGRLRLYPDPAAHRLRIQLAKLHRCQPENIIVGNGSDEVLALAVRTFVEPVGAKRARKASAKNMVQYFNPSYSLYPVLADTHGAAKNEVPLRNNFGLPTVATLKHHKRWRFDAALTFFTTPNAPSGYGYSTREVEQLCAAQRGVMLLDEAYVDFAREHSLELALKYSHVLVARTFSKAYSLCFQRIGYCVGNVDLIAALHKMRDSYNVNGLGQIAAEATLANLGYYRANFRRIIAARKNLSQALEKLGFQVLPSQTNFILAKPPRFPARQWLEKLRDRKILVRWFSAPEVKDFLRITIGNDSETKALLRAAADIINS